VRITLHRRADVATTMLKVAAPAPRRAGETAACWVLASQGRGSSVCTRLGTRPMSGGGEA
jgi:hypothetical protein